MKPLVLIPARGGSKGVPGKNIKLLNGKPLIHYTIEAARQNFDDSIICVSTDDPTIKQCVEATGLSVPFLRPSQLARDNSGSYEVLLHALDYYSTLGYYPDVILLLQPTSPFRTGEHIKQALKLFDSNLDMVVSVKETASNPYFVLFEEDDNGFLYKCKNSEVTSRHHTPKVWEYNGAIYIINVDSLKGGPLFTFKKVKKFVMDEFSSIDIDSKHDWLFAEFMSSKYM